MRTHGRLNYMLYFAVVKGLEGAFLQRALQGPQPGTKETPYDTHPVEINDTNDFVGDLNWRGPKKELIIVPL